jgi:hypothetical protein
MKKKELNDQSPESAVANTAQESEMANRRSFMKNLAAGTVAAGALAGTVVSAGSTKAATIGAQDLTVTPRRATAVMRICFPKQRLPKLDDVFRAIELALKPTGCPSCGFDGLDFLLRVDPVIGPDPAQFVTILEGELVQ